VSDALVTDLYEATMALAYLREDMTQLATFSLFVRKLPSDRGFLVAAGLEQALSYLERLRVDEDDVVAFASALGRPADEVAVLRGLRFTGDVWAVPEGRIVFADEPLLEITAPLPEAQLVETYLLNQITCSTAQASKAARCAIAARGKPVVDFSLRRTHGVDAGMQAARAGALVGFAGTSNVAAAATYDLPAVGTMAHSFVECFRDEQQAFRVFARNTRGPVTLLVDTYDTERGVAIAVQVLSELTDHRGFGVRLDSGDLHGLSVHARRTLDAAGLTDARIVVSGGLDEYAVDELVAGGAPVDVFAVGTKVGTSADAPYVDSAYKLVEYAGRPVMKLSSGKITAPAPKQVFRRAGYRDLLALRDEDVQSGAEPLLEQVMRNGRRVTPPEAPAAVVAAARQRFVTDLADLPEDVRRIRRPATITPETSARLTLLTDSLRRELDRATLVDTRASDRSSAEPTF
jgi:nicotinate phosphoribosyltransferase